MRKFIAFVAVAAGVFTLFGLTSALLSSANEQRSTPIHLSSSERTSTTITVDSSSGSVAWSRLRWLLAGLSLSAVALVSVRQISVVAAPKRPVGRHLRTGPAPRPAQPYGVPAHPWMPEGTHVSIGD